MGETDSDLEILSAAMNRIQRIRSPVRRFEKANCGDDDSLYETINQKTKKMNKRKRVVLKNGLTNVTYKNISKKRRRYAEVEKGVEHAGKQKLGIRGIQDSRQFAFG